MSEPTLASLRAAGAGHHDPLRFHYLEALARRLPTQPVAVQQVLARKLQQAVRDYDVRARAAPAADAQARTATPDSPLRQLNRQLHERSQTPTDSVRVDGGSGTQLKSARRFNEVWARIAAEQQFRQTLARGPENAGPLNSHKLMLRSLALMHALSPDYLRHFLSRMDALLWLEQANTKFPVSETGSGRRERRKP